ncbi:hypothetical protein QYF61_010185, partial [Mycteria americana]
MDCDDTSLTAYIRAASLTQPACAFTPAERVRYKDDLEGIQNPSVTETGNKPRNTNGTYLESFGPRIRGSPRESLSAGWRSCDPMDLFGIYKRCPIWVAKTVTEVGNKPRNTNVHVFPVLRAPELDAVLQVGSHQSRVEGQNHIPRPAGHNSFEAAQDVVGFLGSECTLSAHVQLFIHQYPQLLLCRTALNPFVPQPVLIPGVVPTLVQDAALGLVEPHEVHMGPLLKLLQVPLDGIPSLSQNQDSVICKCAEDALNLTVYIVDEDIKQYSSYSVDVTIQPIPYPPKSPSIKSVHLKFREKDVIHLSHFNISSLIYLLVVLMFFNGQTLGYMSIYVITANELADNTGALRTTFRYMGRVHWTSSGSLDNHSSSRLLAPSSQHRSSQVTMCSPGRWLKSFRISRSSLRDRDQ